MMSPNKKLFVIVFMKNSYLCVFLAKLVQDVGGIEAGVVAQLSRYDLRGKGKM